MTAFFETCDEMQEIVKRLTNERSDIFGFIEPDKIICGLRTDKEAPESQKWTLKIEGIRNQRTLLTDKKYIIHGYASVWDRLDQSHKIAHIANMLLRIEYPTAELLSELAQKGKDFEWGKVKQPDLKDLKKFVKVFGVDWDEESVPNILEEKELAI